MRKYLIFGLIIALCVCTAPAAACDPYDPHTQGYWKNHPENWPVPPHYVQGLKYEDNFHLSGQNWMALLQTPPRGGNAYYTLAHQYIAAVLNMYSGNWAPYAKIDEAEALFADYKPEEIGKLKGNDPLRQQFISLAEYLDDYNNGRLKG
ncbi:hypothetical protein F8E02_10870 [Methanoculleus sp. Wushi-C6]|uniref:Uncharacterized protein n=1 Tax=Methanoculleus caldifontis TaxID=2651577 RepID=A0ABU3X4E3_9EURY|nr:hypothetical protein [Methanoculleus sp. Wushi-C6]MDV2482492.1 hypothetical protein [Methanoculleus sp. Wushi-C6]